MAIIQQDTQFRESLDDSLERAKLNRAKAVRLRRKRAPLDFALQLVEAGAAPIGAALGATVGGVATGGNPVAIKAGLDAGGGVGTGVSAAAGIGRNTLNEEEAGMADAATIRRRQLFQLLAQQ